MSYTFLNIQDVFNTEVAILNTLRPIEGNSVKDENCFKISLTKNYKELNPSKVWAPGLVTEFQKVFHLRLHVNLI